MEEKTFSHSGDVGDLIAALPTIKAKGGGKLVLFPASYTGHRMTGERVTSLRPLLLAQDYISSVEWGEGPSGLNLDGWRRHYNFTLNLADMVSQWQGLPHWPREQPWLTVPSVNRVARVVFARSSRYQNWNFTPVWKRAWEKYRHEAIFVGHPEEHRDFVAYVGPVAHYTTANYLELARVIAGAELFIGNQSSPFWVAEGLKKRVVLEVCLTCQNCHYGRAGLTYGVNEATPLPDLEHELRKDNMIFDFDVTPFLNPADPWPRSEKPEDVRGIYTFKHKVCSLLKPATIVEIGVRAGYSAAAFLTACPSASYFGVDINQHGASGGTAGMLDYARTMLPRSFPTARITIKEGDSRNLDCHLPPVDLAHVDGDHSFLGCLADLYLVERSGAKYILLDDLLHCPEVKAAAVKFLDTRPYNRMFFPTLRGDLLIDLCSTPI